MVSNCQINNSSRWWQIWHPKPFDKGPTWRRTTQMCCGGRKNSKRDKTKCVLRHNRHSCNNRIRRCLRCKGCLTCRTWRRWWITPWWKKWWTTLKWWKWLQKWWAIWVGECPRIRKRCKKWWRTHHLPICWKTLIFWHRHWTCWSLQWRNHSWKQFRNRLDWVKKLSSKA